MARASSGSCLSSELRLEEYLELNMAVAFGRSDWKSQGSEIKTRSTFSLSRIVRRSLETREKPSQFQEAQLSLSLSFGASEESDLSEHISLNDEFRFLMCHSNQECQDFLDPHHL